MLKNNRILVIGSSNTDMTLKTSHLPARGETLLGQDFKISPGGKGANQAVAAKRLGKDCPVSLICKVGSDVFGSKSIENFSREGIDTSKIMRSSKPSGVAMILVDDNGDNSIAISSGANYDITVEDIGNLRETISEAGVVLLQLELLPEVVFRAAQIAHESGAYVILNPAPAVSLPSEIFSFVDLFTPNQSEAEFYTGIKVSDAASATRAAEDLVSKGVKNVIITMGSEGSVGYWNGNSFFTPAQKVKAVDATAAGDTFCGALAVALCEGESLREAAEFATAASALAVQKMGAQDSIPYRKDISTQQS